MYAENKYTKSKSQLTIHNITIKLINIFEIDTIIQNLIGVSLIELEYALLFYMKSEYLNY